MQPFELATVVDALGREHNRGHSSDEPRTGQIPPSGQLRSHRLGLAVGLRLIRLGEALAERRPADPGPAPR